MAQSQHSNTPPFQTQDPGSGTGSGTGSGFTDNRSLITGHQPLTDYLLLITVYSPSTSTSGFPTDPDGGLISRYAAIVAAMSWGPTGLLTVWAEIPLPAKNIGT